LLAKRSSSVTSTTVAWGATTHDAAIYKLQNTSQIPLSGARRVFPIIIFFVELQEILFAAQEMCGLERDRPLLAAVSGGPDSLFLLDSLWRLGFPLIVAHLNHGLRPEAAQEAEAVGQAAQARGLPFVPGWRDVNAWAGRQRFSLEEAARALRYEFLFAEAKKAGAQAVVTGHTADDQAETVLMHFLNGAGPVGLGGMAFRSLPNAWSQTIPLARPLLAVWRSDILAALEATGLHPTQDPSNQDQRFLRNRLRHSFLPYLEELAPGLRRRLWNLAAILSDEEQVMEAQVEAAWQACQGQAGPGEVSFQAAALAAQPPAIQRRLLRRAAAGLRAGWREFDFNQVETARRFLARPTRSRQMTLAAGLRLELRQGRLCLSTGPAAPDAWPQLAPGERLPVAVPGCLALNAGWRLLAQALPAAPAICAQARANPDPYQAWLAFDRLEAPLTLRPRRPGDRFAPLGMAGHSLKLADLMTNLHLPRPARDGWPLLVCNEAILWLPGYRLAQAAALQPDTAIILHLHLYK